MDTAVEETRKYVNRTRRIASGIILLRVYPSGRRKTHGGTRDVRPRRNAGTRADDRDVIIYEYIIITTTITIIVSAGRRLTDIADETCNRDDHNISKRYTKTMEILL